MLARMSILAAALVAFAPSAHAQFTGVVVPPKKEAPAVTDSAAVVAAAQADRQTQLQDMRAWVDSAAASLGVQAATADSTAPVATTTVESQGSVATTASVGSMDSGMRAPDTASMLPLIMLIGAVFLSAGTFLVCTRRPRPQASTTGARTSERHA